MTYIYRKIDFLIEKNLKFKRLEKFEEKLEIKTYFANSYHSWKRKINENINELLRNLFSKRDKVSKVNKRRGKYSSAKIKN